MGKVGEVGGRGGGGRRQYDEDGIGGGRGRRRRHEGEQWEAVAGRPRWQGEALVTLSIKLRSDNNVG